MQIYCVKLYCEKYKIKLLSKSIIDVNYKIGFGWKLNTKAHILGESFLRHEFQ